MVQRRYLILTTLLLLIAGAGAHAQLPDGTIKISGIRPAEVRFTSDGRYFMAKLSDTLRIYETATGLQAGGIPVPKVDGYAAGFLAGDSTVLVMRYNWGLYYHVWNWRKGILVDSQKVWRQVQWAHVLGSGRKMVIKVPETTDPTKQYEMWNTIGEATYLGSFLDKTFQGFRLAFDSAGEVMTSFVVAPGSGSNLFPVRIQIHPRQADVIDTIRLSAQPFRDLYLSADGRRIVVTRSRGVQRVFDGLTLDSLYVVDIPKVQSVIARFDFAPANESLLCVAAPDTGTARLEIYNGATGQIVKVVASDSLLATLDLRVSSAGTAVVLFRSDPGAEATDMYVVPLKASTVSVEAIAGVGRRFIKAFPNPANNELYVEYDQQHSGAARICLVSASGEEIYARKYDARPRGKYNEQFEIDGIPEIACFVVVESEGERDVVPVIIRR